MKSGYTNFKKSLMMMIVVSLTIGILSGCNKEGDVSISDSSSSGSATSTDTISVSGEDSGSSLDDSLDASLDGSSVQDSGSASQDSAGSSSAAGNSAAESLKVNQTGFPIISGGKLQISIMIPRQAGMPADYETLDFTKKYQEMTGIDIKFIVIGEGEQFEKKQAAISSGNVPDIFAIYSAVFTSGEIYKYAKEGLFVEVGSKLAKWAPNISKTLASVPAAKSSSTLSDGKIYSLPNLVSPAYGQHWVINKKWLTELGLAMPKTIDEFYNVLKMFKSGDPNGNNQADEQGFAMWEWNPNMWNPWGLDLNWYKQMSVDETGKVAVGPLTTNFREGIRFWNKCYNEGLVYKKAIGANYTEFQAILAQGKVGCFIWPWPQTCISEAQLYDYVPFAFPKGNNTGNFKAGVSTYSNGVTPNSVIITKSCKSVEAALRFLDYFYTPEGAMLKSYGAPGTYYNIIAGKFKMLTVDPLKTPRMGVDASLIGGNYQFPKTLLLQKHESEMSFVEKYAKYFNELAITTLSPGVAKYQIGNGSIMLNEKEAKRANELMTLISPSYTWGINAIMGATNVETEWNAFVKEYEDKGAKELAQIYQAAFDRAYK
ncbi:MAG: extracellular solute-binding protein [Saccharofermentanales bacterium]